MGNQNNQQKTFQFLLENFKTQEPFTKQDLDNVTTWRGQSFPTYWSKHIRTLVVHAGAHHFRVSEAFRPYSSWDKFRNLVTQVRRASSEYSSLVYENLIVYEFFMPLNNETHLRTALDSLFYKNTILSRLKTLDIAKLKSRFPGTEGENETTYLQRMCKWISARFGGYSVSHVAGRFRAAELQTMREVAELLEGGGKYLVDETTAVVRFIFFSGNPVIRRPPWSSEHFDDSEPPPSTEPNDAKLVRWFFGALFVQSIIQVINGEDEIWMVESGMRNRLHIWRVDS